MHFPLFNTLRHTRLCLAALTLGLGIHLPSQAQDGTLVAAGQITTSTCLLFFRDFGTNNTNFNSKSFALGSFNTSNLSTTKGALISPTVGTVFGIQSPFGPNFACLGTATVFDVSIQLSPEQIVTITGTGLNTNTFLKNSLSAADGGTDAVVLLKGGLNTKDPALATVNDADKPLTLKPNVGLAGNYASGLSSPGISTTWKYLTATLVNGNGGQVSPGRYVQTIQLMAVYN